MPKLKIKNWKGLYTNIDENEQSLEMARASINWRHSRGRLEFEPRFLSEYTLPEIDPILGGNWEWETGIYTTLTNDPFDQDGVATKYDCLILVAKQDDGSQYNRLVYLKDLDDTTSSLGTNGWYELSKNGNVNYVNILNHDGAGSFADSYFSTTEEGKAYFREESGHIKLFLPHMAYWIGRMERALKTPYANYDFLDDAGATHWYIDKLIDGYDPNITVSPLEPGAFYPECPYPTRLWWVGGVSTSTDDVERNRDIELGTTKTFTYARIEDGHNETTTIYGWDAKFKESGEPIPTTVTPFAPSMYSQLINHIYAYDSFLDYATPATDLICFQEEFFTYFEAYDANGIAIPILSLPHPVDTPAVVHSSDSSIQINGSNSAYTFGGRGSYIMTKSTFTTNNWRYKGVITTSTDGFDETQTEFNLIVTAILDEREEVIVKHINKTVDEAAPWKIVITGGMLVPDSNYRVTRLRYYIKLGTEEVYSLYKDIEFLNTTDTEVSNSEMANFDMIEGDNTAILLAQNIGIEPDDKRWDSYKVIEGFRDFRTESGVSIGISNQDYSNVYYSVLGGGNLQPDLMYTQNILRVAGANVVNAVAVVNTDLAVFTDDTMYIVRVVDEVGALVFTIRQALEFGVKNQFDIAPMQGGLAINTRHGIYSTTGTQSNLLSEPIDDVCKEYFETSSILYNKDIHELYYKRNSSDNLYRFRFKDAVWEVVNKY